MAEQDDDPLSPTVTKVLDEYLAALHADNAIDNEAADRLDALLRKGKVPKSEEIDAALFPPAQSDEP
jgi:hypothetical protein